MAAETSKPKAKKGPAGPEQLPQGGASQVNAGLSLVPSPDPTLIAATEDIEPQGRVTEHDDILFAGTDHPNEPITTGAPFGPGANFTTQGPERDSEFLARAAAEIAASPAASPRVRAFVARVARGE